MRCSSVVECLHETVFQSMEHCSPIRMNERLTHATSWDELVILWENQPQTTVSAYREKVGFWGLGKRKGE